MERSEEDGRRLLLEEAKEGRNTTGKFMESNGKQNPLVLSINNSFRLHPLSVS